jgi:hypothetical protein
MAVDGFQFPDGVIDRGGREVSSPTHGHRTVGELHPLGHIADPGGAADVFGTI